MGKTWKCNLVTKDQTPVTSSCSVRAIWKKASKVCQLVYNVLGYTRYTPMYKRIKFLSAKYIKTNWNDIQAYFIVTK